MLHGAFQTLVLRYYSTFYHVCVAPLSSTSSSQRNLCRVVYLTKPPWNIVDTLEYSILYFVLPIRCPLIVTHASLQGPPTIFLYDVGMMYPILKKYSNKGCSLMWCFSFLLLHPATIVRTSYSMCPTCLAHSIFILLHDN